MHPMQAAFKECHGLQCGFCTPGMVMSAIDLCTAPSRRQRGRNPRTARRQPVPLHRLPEHRQGRADGRQGHGRSRHRRAEGEAIMGASDFAKLPHIGEALKRKEDYRFLTGAGQYTDDVNLAHQAYAVFVRSPHAHATIKSRRHRQAARQMPGVVGHLHRQGHRGQDGRAALRLADQQPRRHADEGAAAPDPRDQGKVRYVGDHVAMVVAETRGAGAQRGRSGGGGLRGAARRGQRARMPRRSRAASPSTMPRRTTSATSGRIGRQGARSTPCSPRPRT